MNYRTDRWPPGGDGVNGLAWFFRVATALWLAWPVIHLLSAVVYRLRRAMSRTRPESSPAQSPLLDSTGTTL